MQIHQISSRNTESPRRRGRGGKRGTYSGRGMKGQKSRSGGNVDPLFEGGRSSLIDRLKKLKGFKSISAKKNSVRLDKIEMNYTDGETISAKTLVKKGLVDPAKVKDGIKLIGGGTLTKKLEVKKGIFLTQSAKDAIVKVGGALEKAEEK